MSRIVDSGKTPRQIIFHLWFFFYFYFIKKKIKTHKYRADARMVIGIFCKKIDMFVRVGSIPTQLIKYKYLGFINLFWGKIKFFGHVFFFYSSRTTPMLFFSLPSPLKLYRDEGKLGFTLCLLFPFRAKIKTSPI